MYLPNIPLAATQRCAEQLLPVWCEATVALQVDRFAHASSTFKSLSARLASGGLVALAALAWEMVRYISRHEADPSVGSTAWPAASAPVKHAAQVGCDALARLSSGLVESTARLSLAHQALAKTDQATTPLWTIIGTTAIPVALPSHAAAPRPLTDARAQRRQSHLICIAAATPDMDGQRWQQVGVALKELTNSLPDGVVRGCATVLHCWVNVRCGSGDWAKPADWLPLEREQEVLRQHVLAFSQWLMEAGSTAPCLVVLDNQPAAPIAVPIAPSTLPVAVPGHDDVCAGYDEEPGSAVLHLPARLAGLQGTAFFALWNHRAHPHARALISLYGVAPLIEPLIQARREESPPPTIVALRDFDSILGQVKVAWHERVRGVDDHGFCADLVSELELLAGTLGQLPVPLDLASQIPGAVSHQKRKLVAVRLANLAACAEAAIYGQLSSPLKPWRHWHLAGLAVSQKLHALIDAATMRLGRGYWDQLDQCAAMLRAMACPDLPATQAALDVIQVLCARATSDSWQATPDDIGRVCLAMLRDGVAHWVVAPRDALHVLQAACSILELSTALSAAADRPDVALHPALTQLAASLIASDVESVQRHAARLQEDEDTDNPLVAIHSSRAAEAAQILLGWCELLREAGLHQCTSRIKRLVAALTQVSSGGVLVPGLAAELHSWAKKLPVALAEATRSGVLSDEEIPSPFAHQACSDRLAPGNEVNKEATPSIPAGPTTALQGGLAPEDLLTELEEDTDPRVIAAVLLDVRLICQRLATTVAVAPLNAPVSRSFLGTAHNLLGLTRLLGINELPAAVQTLEHWAAACERLQVGPTAKDRDLIGRLLAGVLQRLPGPAPTTNQEAGSTDLAQDIRALADVTHQIESRQAEHAAQANPQANRLNAEDGAPEADPAAISADRDERFLTSGESTGGGVDAELADIFRSEVEELLAEMAPLLNLVRAGQQLPLAACNRILHTLKGSVRMVGLEGLGSLIHDLESRLSTASLAELSGKELLEALDAACAEIAAAAIRVGDRPATLASPDPSVIDISPPGTTAERQTAPALVRIESRRLEELARLGALMRERRERLPRPIEACRQSLSETRSPLLRLQALTDAILLVADSRISSGSRSSNPDPHFDALELDRFEEMHELARRLREAAADVMEHVHTATFQAAQAHHALQTLSETSNSLDADIARLGQAPLLAVQSRLRALVKQVANEVGRQAQFSVIDDIRLDRAVLDAVTPALEHLVRNSICHGLEDAGTRKSRGKAAWGTITLRGTQHGRYAELTLQDDGNGVDLARVRAKCVALGWAADPDELDDQHALDMILKPGFSTAETLSQNAGRGVGMDAVQDMVTRLGGRMELESTAGLGLCVKLRLPVSSQHVNGLQLTAAGHPYVLPAAAIRRIVSLRVDAVEAALVSEDPTILLDDGLRARVYSLPSVLGLPDDGLHGDFAYGVLLRDSNALLVTDRVEHVDQLPVKALSPDVPGSYGLMGYCSFDDGSVGVVLSDKALSLGLDAARTQMAYKSRSKPVVLVTDDSVTVRRVLQTLLERQGYEVVCAETGRGAVQRLVAMGYAKPDAILMDIEMPQMDGFEALTLIKGKPEWAAIPFAFITSRTASKHRLRAAALGAQGYFGKPFNDQDILAFVAAACSKHARTIQSQGIANRSLVAADDEA